MSDDLIEATVPLSVYREAVEAARREGAASVTTDPQAAQEAVEAERERVAGIVEAGARKPAAQVSAMIREGVSLETARTILSAAPDEVVAASGLGLSEAMAGSNPRIVSDNGDEDEDEDGLLNRVKTGAARAHENR